MGGKAITWIIAADGARARIFVSEGAGRRVREIEDRAFIGSRRTGQEIQADKPGRTFDSAGQGRHVMEPKTDPQRNEERKFLREVVEWITAKGLAGDFDHLVLIAAPKALGDLRELLPKTIAGRITGEIAKDLTRASPGDIETALSGIRAA